MSYSPHMFFPVASVPGRRIVYSNDFGDCRKGPTGPCDHPHGGIDIFSMAGEDHLAGAPLIATVSGHATSGSDGYGGNVVIVHSADAPPLAYYYAHLDKFEGSYPRDVVAGEVLGYMGSTGSASGGWPHLHFEMWPDPSVLNSRGAPQSANPYNDLVAAQVVDGVAEASSKWGVAIVFGALAVGVGVAVWFGMDRSTRAHLTARLNPIFSKRPFPIERAKTWALQRRPKTRWEKRRYGNWLGETTYEVWISMRQGKKIFNDRTQRWYYIDIFDPTQTKLLKSYGFIADGVRKAKDEADTYALGYALRCTNYRPKV
jgi:hypothetical protein